LTREKLIAGKKGISQQTEVSGEKARGPDAKLTKKWEKGKDDRNEYLLKHKAKNRITDAGDTSSPGGENRGT